jgi:hypothetical protein
MIVFDGNLVPERLRLAVHRAIAHALTHTRSPGEHWTVRASDLPQGTTITFSFSRDHEAPRSITVALDGDDAE